MKPVILQATDFQNVYFRPFHKDSEVIKKLNESEIVIIFDDFIHEERARDALKNGMHRSWFVLVDGVFGWIDVRENFQIISEFAS